MKRSVVTGGAGFIGSHLCERLIKEGHEVICVDNLLTGCAENLASLRHEVRFHFIQQDVSRPLQIQGGLDFVFHLASPASPIHYQRYPIETMEVGSVGTRCALELAREKQAVFFLASTSEVYGDPTVNPQPENYWGNVNPTGPRGVYDEAKRFAEAMTMAYHRAFGVKTCIARIFNTFGPRMQPDDGRVIPSFIVQALKGQPLTVFGRGEQTRSFCYIDDMIEGIWRLAQAAIPEPINLGSTYEITVLDLAKEILRLTGSSSPIVFAPLPEGDPKQRRPDLSKAQRYLNWAPRWTLLEGLKQTIAWFCDHSSVR
jgi:dTDP-glucose 4,6-dehydratase